jgi:RimJ/RimL family protein N-acetyltransferase
VIAASRIETERLVLRRFNEKDDFDDYAKICANPDIMRFIGGKALDRLEAWRSFAYHVGHWELRGYGYYAAIEKATGRFAGRIGYTNSQGWPGFELGWTLAPEFHGRGYATEGARRLLAYAFEDLGMPHVISLIHPENVASQRVARRLGEKPEGQTQIFGMPVVIWGIDRPKLD